MVKPTVLKQPTVTYSKEAMAMRQGGVALVKCIVNLDGSLSDCVIQKGVPYMDQQILQMTREFRYSGPVTFQGQPVRVTMIIPFRIPAPT
jgi:protein TonB